MECLRRSCRMRTSWLHVGFFLVTPRGLIISCLASSSRVYVNAVNNANSWLLGFLTFADTDASYTDDVLRMFGVFHWLPASIYFFLSIFPWRRGWKERLHRRCKGCNDYDFVFDILLLLWGTAFLGLNFQTEENGVLIQLNNTNLNYRSDYNTL